MSFSSLITEIFQDINNARTSPSLFAERLSSLQSSFIKSKIRLRKFAVPVQTYEGLPALQEAVQSLRSTKPMLALEMSEGLRRAAQSHCNDSGHLGTVGHNGSHSSMQDRVELFGSWSDLIGETLDYGSVNAFESVSNLMIDDGLPSRPHRNILLNPRFKKIGIGIAKHVQYSTVVCCVLASEFYENTEMRQVGFSNEIIEVDPDLKEWIEGAVKVSCEVRTEGEGGRVVRKVRKVWEMADGSVHINEELSKH